MTQTEQGGCRAAAKQMQDAVEAYEARVAEYQKRQAEYQRRLSMHQNVNLALANTCSGKCANGGTIRYGCHPMCRNLRRLFPAPIDPGPAPTLSLGNFVCAECKQYVDLNVNADGSVDARNAVQQQMNCIASLESMRADEESARERERNESSAAPTRERMIVFAIIAIVIVAIVVAMIVAVLLLDGASADVPAQI